MSYLIICDPSGAYSARLIESGVTPVDITVYDDTHKGQQTCAKRGVTVTDNLEELTGMRFDVIIGNPPYGNGGNQAIKFLNQLGDLGDDIRLIMPLSVRKVSAMNKIRLDFVCVEDERLPDDTFGRPIHTCRQRWVRTTTPREKVVLHRTHPDFEFCDRHDLSANVFIMRVGYAGKVMTEDFEKYRDSSTNHHFLRVTDSKVIQRLRDCEPQFRELSQETNGLDVLSKHELITIYSAAS